MAGGKKKTGLVCGGKLVCQIKVKIKNVLLSQINSSVMVSSERELKQCFIGGTMIQTTLQQRLSTPLGEM